MLLRKHTGLCERKWKDVWLGPRIQDPQLEEAQQTYRARSSSQNLSLPHSYLKHPASLKP
jgi:hypothetical protein